jgi:Reverse transcriptase (RNA-dependent DNA polymerase)/RNase H-like domain found in reverse transcriptase
VVHIQTGVTGGRGASSAAMPLQHSPRAGGTAGAALGEAATLEDAEGCAQDVAPIASGGSSDQVTATTEQTSGGQQQRGSRGGRGHAVDDESWYLAAQCPALVALTTGSQWPSGRQTTNVPATIEAADGAAVTFSSLIDSGSDLSLITAHLMQSAALREIPVQPLKKGEYTSVGGVEQRGAVKLQGRVDVLLRISDASLVTRLYVAETLPVPMILGGDFQLAHSASLVWRKGSAYYKPCPAAAAIVTTATGQTTDTNFTCTAATLLSSGSDTVQEGEQPAAIAVVTGSRAEKATVGTEQSAEAGGSVEQPDRERVALALQEELRSDGWGIAMEESAAGASGVVRVNKETAIPGGTRVVVWAASSVQPKLHVRSLAVVCPGEGYDGSSSSSSESDTLPPLMIARAVVRWGHGLPVAVAVVNTSAEAITLSAGTVIGTISEATCSVQDLRAVAAAAAAPPEAASTTEQGQKATDMLRALRSKLEELEQSVQQADARRHAAEDRPAVSLTHAELELQRMYEAAGGDVAESRGAGPVSAEEAKWRSEKVMLHGEKLKAVVQGMKFGTLTTDERAAAEAMLMQHAAVLPLNAKAPAAIAPGFEVEVQTGGAKPQKTSGKGRRFAQSELDEMRERIAFWLREGIITPSTSPWCAPLVAARKKDGSLRLCVDFRALNEVTQKDAFSLPRIDDILSQMSGAGYFSVMDLASGYHQIPLAPGAQEKTAFSPPWGGLYEFKRAPFGLSSLPGQFSRLMSAVLHEALGVYAAVFLDDVVIYSKNFKQHLKHVDRVLQLLERAGLQISPNKCEWFTQEVRYLGQVLSCGGRRPDEKKVEALAKMRAPTSNAELQTLLGGFGYHRQYIKDYAAVVEPLQRLLAFEGPWQDDTWGEEQQRVFDKVKQLLCSAPILAWPDFSLPFLVYTDGSAKGVGGVLAQEHDGKIHPVAYCSRRLSEPERR